MFSVHLISISILGQDSPPPSLSTIHYHHQYFTPCVIEISNIKKIAVFWMYKASIWLAFIFILVILLLDDEFALTVY